LQQQEQLKSAADMEASRARWREILALVAGAEQE
jgi:hypothetical protein